MPNIAVKRPGYYLVELRSRDLPLPLISMRTQTREDGERLTFVPALSHMTYLLACEQDNVQIECDPTEVQEITLRPIYRLTRLFRLLYQNGRPFSVDIAKGVNITLLLREEGRPGKELRKVLRLIGKWGVDLSSPILREIRTLQALRQAPQAPSSIASLAKKTGHSEFAVVLHLHYRDLWPEFETDLLKLKQRFHLIITTTEVDREFEAQVRRVFADTEIYVFENRGRDVGPFFQLLHDGHLADYSIICKLHGKRSGTDGPRALFGEVWRRINVADLIGSSEQVQKILSRFKDVPDLGMIGSHRFRMPNEFTQRDGAWAGNEQATLTLAERLGIDRGAFHLDFFAGTMFWITQEALEPLRNLNLTLADFPAETGAIDGDLQHALERLFGAAPGCAGKSLEDTRQIAFQRLDL